MVNYIKSSALNTQPFQNRCLKYMDAEHKTLVYHTEVGWLSKGNVLSLLDLHVEVKEFFNRILPRGI